MNQIIVLYTLNLYSAVCQLYLKKTGRKKEIVILTVPKGGGGMPYHRGGGPTQGRTRVNQEAEGVRGKLTQEPLLWFPQEGRGKAG